MVNSHSKLLSCHQNSVLSLHCCNLFSKQLNLLFQSAHALFQEAVLCPETDSNGSTSQADGMGTCSEPQWIVEAKRHWKIPRLRMSRLKTQMFVQPAVGRCLLVESTPASTLFRRHFGTRTFSVPKMSNSCRPTTICAWIEVSSEP